MPPTPDHFIRQVLSADRREAKLPDGWRSWPNKRKLLAVLAGRDNTSRGMALVSRGVVAVRQGGEPIEHDLGFLPTARSFERILAG